MTQSERPWARHYQDEWGRKAGDPRMPYWLRVAALAYGSHGYNGHAVFKRGEIALVLATVDQETGEIHPFENVGRAIRDAVEYGWLAPESFWGCLVVPAHAIRKGAHGRKSECSVHVRRQTRSQREPVTERRLRGLPATASDGFEPRTAHSVTGSQRAPLSLVSQPNPTQDGPQADRSA